MGDATVDLQFISRQIHDVELMIKAELAGSLAHLQTKLENDFTRLDDRISDVRDPRSALETKAF